jgi:hypothetical protein
MMDSSVKTDLQILVNYLNGRSKNTTDDPFMRVANQLENLMNGKEVSLDDLYA